MGKVEANKRQKKESLLNTAFALFTQKGFQNTSISEIVSNAGVAKGTFYLYFTDKYDLRNKVIAHKASRIFLDAYHEVKKSGLADIEDQIIFITNYVIDLLARDRSLLSFISKHLSWGLFRNTLISYQTEEEESASGAFLELIQSSGRSFRNFEVMIYMIIELVSGAIYNPILYGQPVSLEEIKPYVFESVRAQVRMHLAD